MLDKLWYNNQFLGTVERFLGFKYSCSEYMITLVYLYAEIFLICFMIFFFVSDVLFEGLYRFSKFRTVAKYQYDALGRIIPDSLEFRTVAIRENIFPKRYLDEVESALDLSFLLFPTIVVVYMLIPSLGFLYSHEFDMNNLDTFLTVIITGHQWYWTYEYHFFNFAYLQGVELNTNLYTICFDSVLILDEGERYESRFRNAPEGENRLLTVDRRLVLPVNVSILLYATSTDVIHSWALPQFGIKIDAIPGRLSSAIINSFTTGVFCGQCSELCGVNHGFMPIVVEFVDFDTFLSFVFICLFAE